MHNIRILRIMFAVIFCVMLYSPSILAVESFQTDGWYLSIGGGYDYISNMQDEDGDTPFLRLSVGKKLVSRQAFSLSSELGIETGARMRLKISDAERGQLGGLPYIVNLKPNVDILLASQFPIFKDSIYLVSKVGGAYRELQSERCSMKNLKQVSPEIQAGVIFPISKYASLNLLYKNIISGPLHYKIDYAENSLIMSGMPMQQGFLLNIVILLDDKK